MAFKRPRVGPSGVPKKVCHLFMDCRLFIKLPSKPLVEEVIRLGRRDREYSEKHREWGKRRGIHTEGRAMRGG